MGLCPTASARPRVQQGCRSCTRVLTLFFSSTFSSHSSRAFLASQFGGNLSLLSSSTTSWWFSLRASFYAQSGSLHMVILDPNPQIARARPGTGHADHRAWGPPPCALDGHRYHRSREPAALPRRCRPSRCAHRVPASSGARGTCAAAPPASPPPLPLPPPR